ncbi:hypothetical protein LCGC14_2752510, partial [marine sediment metagenome]
MVFGKGSQSNPSEIGRRGGLRKIELGKNKFKELWADEKWRAEKVIKSRKAMLKVRQNQNMSSEERSRFCSEAGKKSREREKRTIEKIKLIRKHGIDCNIMFTLYPSNASELIPLMRFLAMNTEATSFSFDIGVMSGNANSMKNQFTAFDIHNLFTEYDLEKKRLKEEDYSIFFHEKSNFHKLINFENDELYPIVPKNGNVLTGVYSGWNSLS